MSADILFPALLTFCSQQCWHFVPNNVMNNATMCDENDQILHEPIFLIFFKLFNGKERSNMAGHHGIGDR